MSKQLLLLLILASFSFFASAQKKISPFGKIDTQELELKSCSYEPAANAMKLFDVQEIEFEPSASGVKLTTERRVRIKIFNEKGYKYASIRIPYFSKKRVTKIKNLDGVVYSVDEKGQQVIQKLEKKDFFKEKSEDNLGIINFTFPNLKPGCVIEFRYTKIEKNIIQIDPWIIQDEIPVAYASTILTIPGESRIKQKVFGADTIDHQTVSLGSKEYSRKRHIYQKENISSFDPEPFMSSHKDNLLKVVFLLIPYSDFFTDLLLRPKAVWNYTGRSLLRSPNFGGQIKKEIPGTETIIDSALKIPVLSERIRYLYESVQKIAPDNPEQTLYPDDIIEAWNNKTGSSAELNLILLNLLQKSDVIAFPLLVSTRNNGKIDMEFPSFGQLNGVDVLAADSNKVYIMDASLKYQLYNNPPINIMNRNAYLLSKDTMQWVEISDNRPLLKQVLSIKAKVNEDGSLYGNALTWHYDYAKSQMLDSSDEDDNDDFIDKKPLGLKIISSSFAHIENDDEPLQQNIEFNYEPQNTGDFYFINPEFLFIKDKNPFLKETRNTDIDFGSNQFFSLGFRLDIPPGFQVEQLPKNITVRAPDSTFFFKRTIVSDSNGLYLSQTFEIKQSVFPREEYEGIKQFFSHVFAIMAEEIILKKKK